MIGDNRDNQHDSRFCGKYILIVRLLESWLSYSLRDSEKSEVRLG